MTVENLKSPPKSGKVNFQQLAVLLKTDESQISLNHPVRLINDEYNSLKAKCAPQFLPDFNELMISIGSDLAEYCISLSPVEGDPFIDFEVLSRGSKVIGGDSFVSGRLYAEQIVLEMLQERLMELASCIALKRSRLTIAKSAFRTAMNIKVYRGAFPVWNPQIGRHIVLLAIAPVYVAL